MIPRKLSNDPCQEPGTALFLLQHTYMDPATGYTNLSNTPAMASTILSLHKFPKLPSCV